MSLTLKLKCAFAATVLGLMAEQGDLPDIEHERFETPREQDGGKSNPQYPSNITLRL